MGRFSVRLSMLKIFLNDLPVLSNIYTSIFAINAKRSWLNNKNRL
jgi:hypothetical protein